MRHLLKTKPDSVNARHIQGNVTPLHLAAALGFLEIVNELLVHPRLDLHARDHWSRSAFDIAIECGHDECAEAILHKAYPEEFESDEDPFDDES